MFVCTLVNATWVDPEDLAKTQKKLTGAEWPAWLPSTIGTTCEEADASEWHQF